MRHGHRLSRRGDGLGDVLISSREWHGEPNIVE
jgi:hypothetical protein